MNYNQAWKIGNMGEQACSGFLADWIFVNQAAFEACPLEGEENTSWDTKIRIAAKGSDRQKVDRVDLDILYRNHETGEERQCAYEVKTDRETFGYRYGVRGTGNVYVEDITLDESKADLITFICLKPTRIGRVLLYGDYADKRIIPDYDAVTIELSRLREYIRKNRGKLQHLDKSSGREAGYLLPFAEARQLECEYYEHKLQIEVPTPDGRFVPI